MPIQRKVCECGEAFFTAKPRLILCKRCRKGTYTQTWREKRDRIIANKKEGQTWEEWKAKLVEYHQCCVYCGRSLFDSNGKFRGERDHRIPLCRGGSNKIENIVPTCRGCNLHKCKMTYLEYKAKFPDGAPPYYTVSTGSSYSSSPARFPSELQGIHGTYAVVLDPGEVCLAHPESGRTHWNTCWACYTLRCQGKKPSESSMEAIEELRKLR